ncbi:MAG: class A beta-lactamase-related serine hydrolase [Duncaniella sp.]|nr:class A beta-lactamase-related serine hydrolase [Duncaniella sp.]
MQGTVGVAFVSESDTITVNNDVRFPMMSVFKLHQSLAIIHRLDSLGCTADTVLTVCADEIDRDTWSPMLDIYDDKDFRISVGDLIKYSLTVSDNNASNLLFSHIISPAETNAFIKKIASDTTFNIAYSESEMKADHSLSYYNSTTPLSAALLVRQVFTTEMVSQPGQALIKEALSTVATGQDRLGAILKDDDDIFFAHKTGSGYRNYDGKLMAHNDVGYFSFPDGRNYSLAVFITGFNGTEAEASAVTADISRCVYDYYISQNQ